jgi:hypothetical protein
MLLFIQVTGRTLRALPKILTNFAVNGFQLFKYKNLNQY